MSYREFQKYCPLISVSVEPDKRIQNSYIWLLSCNNLTAQRAAITTASVTGG